jgi:hypothetical protein
LKKPAFAHLALRTFITNHRSYACPYVRRRPDAQILVRRKANYLCAVKGNNEYLKKVRAPDTQIVKNLDPRFKLFFCVFFKKSVAFNGAQTDICL